MSTEEYTLCYANYDCGIFEENTYWSNAGCIRKEIRQWLYEYVGIGADSMFEMEYRNDRLWFLEIPPTERVDHAWTSRPIRPLVFYFKDRNMALQFKLLWT